MARKMTLRDAFAAFGGAKARDPRRSWSARSADGRTVVLTLWEDDLHDDGATIRIDMFGEAQRRNWARRWGNKDRIDNLIHARDHCGRLFRVVRLIPKKGMRPPHSTGATDQRHPEASLVMKLTDLDEETGEFRAESVRR